MACDQRSWVNHGYGGMAVGRLGRRFPLSLCLAAIGCGGLTRKEVKLPVSRQERAEHTRQRLVEAAATEFAERGYAGSTLQAVVREAGVTMGGLTFHFPSKAALADAVQQAGEAATAEVLGTGAAPGGLQGVLGETLALAEVVETTPSMRAAARFAREGRESGTVGHNWYASWVPRLRDELERVWREEHLESDLTPGAVAALLSYLVVGVEATSASRGVLRSATGCDAQDALRQLTKALSVLISLDAVPRI